MVIVIWLSAAHLGRLKLYAQLQLRLCVQHGGQLRQQPRLLLLAAGREGQQKTVAQPMQYAASSCATEVWASALPDLFCTEDSRRIVRDSCCQESSRGCNADVNRRHAVA